MNYTINEKTAIKKKIKSCSFLIFNLILFMTNAFNKSCSEVWLQIQMKKENNLKIFCSKTAFENENIRNIIIETIASNYALEKTENRHFRERCARRNHQN